MCFSKRVTTVRSTTHSLPTRAGCTEEGVRSSPLQGRERNADDAASSVSFLADTESAHPTNFHKKTAVQAIHHSLQPFRIPRTISHIVISTQFFAASTASKLHCKPFFKNLRLVGSLMMISRKLPLISEQLVARADVSAGLKMWSETTPP